MYLHYVRLVASRHAHAPNTLLHLGQICIVGRGGIVVLMSKIQQYRQHRLHVSLISEKPILACCTWCMQALEQAQEKEALAQAAAAEATVQRQHAEKVAAELDVLRQEAAELKADAETRGAAMEGLHATLKRIERIGMQRADSDTQKSEPLLP